MELEFAHGSLHCRTVEPWLLEYRFTGYLEAAAASKIVELRERALATTASIYELHDWWAMAGYESESRRILTEHSLAMRARIPELHILVQSKMVHMGVSVAKIALGNVLNSYLSREEFVGRREHLRQRGPARDSHTASP